MSNSTIELGVRVKRDGRTVFESTINIPVRDTSAEFMRPAVDQWLGLMEAAVKIIPTTEEVQS